MQSSSVLMNNTLILSDTTAPCLKYCEKESKNGIQNPELE